MQQTTPGHAVPAAPAAHRQYRYYDLITAVFVTVLLCSNLIGPSKVATLWGYTFGAGILFFPISYLFGDILTEVYGYARARRCIWVGTAALLLRPCTTRLGSSRISFGSRPSA